MTKLNFYKGWVEKIGFAILLVAILFPFFTIIEKRRLNLIEDLKESGCFSVASFGSNLSYNSRASIDNYYIDYFFIINNRVYKGVHSFSGRKISMTFFRQELSKQHFPVVFKCNEPDRNKLLVLPEDFEEIGRTYPDSLRQFLPSCISTNNEK